MKKSFILLICCMITLGSINAQHPTRHFISLSRGSAYSNTVRVQPSLPVVCLGGISDNIGLGYQLHHNHFTFGVGVEYDNTIMANMSTEDITTVGFLHYNTIEKGMTELLHNMSFNFPVMLGGEFGKFYFKAGVAPSLSVYGNGGVIGPALNDNSEVWDYEDIHQYRYNRDFQLYARFELGGSFGEFTSFDELVQPKARFYLGAYVDYGIFEEGPKKSIGSYAHYVPYAISDEAFHDVTIPLNVGLRFTCLFNVSK